VRILKINLAINSFRGELSSLRDHLHSVDGSIANSSRLWRDYRAAFKDWALQVKRLRCLITCPATGVVVKEAEDQVKAAELLYRDTRNRLTDDIKRDEKRSGVDRHHDSPQ
jgi:hypothetical protein